MQARTSSTSSCGYSEMLRPLLAYAGGVIPMLTHALGDNPAIDEVFIFGSINVFVFEADNVRLPELRSAGVLVFERRLRQS